MSDGQGPVAEGARGSRARANFLTMICRIFRIGQAPPSSAGPSQKSSKSHQFLNRTSNTKSKKLDLNEDTLRKANMRKNGVHTANMRKVCKEYSKKTEARDPQN